MLMLLARMAWEAKKRTLIVSSEIARERLFLRLLAMLLQLPYGQLRSGKLSSFLESTLYEGVAKLKTAFPLWVTGGAFDVEISSIKAAVEYIKPDIVFIDGINLVRGKGEGRIDMSANVADECKRMGKRYQIPIIGSAQFNRKVKQNATKAELTNIAETDQFGRNADYVFAALQDQDLKLQKIMKVSTLKGRESGDLKDFFISWDWDRQDFSEISANAPDAPSVAESEDDYTPF